MRYHASISLVAAMILVLSGCGSKKVVKKKEEPAPVPAVNAPATPPPITRTAPPPSDKPAPTANSKPESPAPAPTPAAAGPKEGTAEFGDAMVGGHPISEYIAKLDSKNKDEVIEAIAACGVARPKSCVAKITELTKSPDKDIAAEATDALRKIGAGQ